MSSVAPAPTWPADVIHVNEDGWVLINRGRANGVVPGLRIFVVGNGTRELRDLFAAAGSDAQNSPVVLRTRRTYELLEIAHVEEQCAVAIAARVPAARRPQFYRGPGGELLVWIPLPEDYTWPSPGGYAADDDADADDADDSTDAASVDETDGAGDASDTADATADTNVENGDDVVGEAGDDQAADVPAPDVDSPPEHGLQEDERWEQSLPLNGVSVGDIVIPAVPVAPERSSSTGLSADTSGSPTSGGEGADPGTWEKHYDWMPPKTE